MTAKLPMIAAKLPPLTNCDVASMTLPELTDHRRHIGAVVEVMMKAGAYFERGEAEVLEIAVLREWMDRLQGWTPDAIRDAFRAWQDKNPNRRPSPVHILDILKAEWGKLHADQVRAALAPPAEPRRQRISPERHAQIMAEMGIRNPLAVRAMDGGEAAE